eukprot:1468734-Alexandrium_andersonii.AAC.1
MMCTSPTPNAISHTLHPAAREICRIHAAAPTAADRRRGLFRRRARRRPATPPPIRTGPTAAQQPPSPSRRTHTPSMALSTFRRIRSR